MNKKEFSELLRTSLAGLPQRDIEERVAFYEEMIDDRLEEGMSEEEAVRMVGPVGEIVRQTIAETPITRLVKEKVTPKHRLAKWEVIVLAVTSPVWISLIIAAVAIVFALFVTIWAVWLAFWAAFVCIASCSICGGALGTHTIFKGYVFQGIAVIGASMALGGLAILFYYVCVGMTKLCVKITRWLAGRIKRKFVKGEVR